MLHLDASAWNKLQRIIPSSSRSRCVFAASVRKKHEESEREKLRTGKVDPKVQIENVIAYARHTEVLCLSFDSRNRRVGTSNEKETRRAQSTRKELDKENIRAI